MDYEFFHALTAEEAQTFLNRFLEVERQGMKETRSQAARDGVDCDYSIGTLADVLKWIVKQVRVHRVPVPEQEPWWIRQAHPDGVAEFGEDSKAILMRAGYYLGECFARLPGLRWTTGNPEYLEKNMPVIAGFRGDQELPPLVVVENMFARIVADGGLPERIDGTLDVWLRDCPAAGD
jgi:hypothetical protein